MESAIGSLFFLIAVAAICALGYKHREAIGEWLNDKGRPERDQRLQTLEDNLKAAKTEVTKYQRRLELQKRIKDASEEIAEMESGDNAS